MSHWLHLLLFALQVTLCLQTRSTDLSAPPRGVLGGIMKPLFTMAEASQMIGLRRSIATRAAHHLQSQHFQSQVTVPHVHAMNTAMTENAFDPPAKVKPLIDLKVGAWNPLEVGAIAAYTTPAFRPYNEHWRSGNKSVIKEYRDYSSNLLKGLKRLPPFHGTVFRGLSTDDTYEVGHEIKCDGFTSTSVDRAQADHFSGSPTGHTMLEIVLQGNRARLIDDFSTRPEEREVLLPPGTTLKVTAVEEENGGRRVMMEEVVPSEADTQFFPEEEFYAGTLDMHTAAKNGLVNIAETLKGSQNVHDWNEFDTSGKTPMHYAAEYGHCQMIEFLATSKADVNAMSNSGITGFTPLQLAMEHDKTFAMQELLKQAAVVDPVEKSDFVEVS